ncbi:MAG: hypothetical protein GY730_11500 [bacterium]|nr:hypothetical protein [bacterium]
MKQILFLIFIFIISAAGNLFSVQNYYYPVIFVHGHSGDIDVENSWEYMAKKLQSEDYSYYGKIWEESNIPLNLSEKTMFLFGFYRRNSNEYMGSTTGKIGGFPINQNDVSSMVDVELQLNLFINFPILIPWYRKYDVNYKNDYFDPNRYSFAERLKTTVDKVLQATNSKKVILICHSMGGLVARSYIKWLGGEKKVFKLLMAGTPNKGIADDNRAAFKKIFNSQNWQSGGEYLEMSVRKNFIGKSFTDQLNDGWHEFCTKNGVRYATIAGNKDPWPLLDIGSNSDGAIDRDSVRLNGAEFNGLSFASHTGEFPLIGRVDNEENILKSTYTFEIIKRWILRDEVHINATIDPLIGPVPFSDRFVFQYESGNSSAVVSTMRVYNIAGDTVLDTLFPVYYGFHQPVFNLGFVATGVYIAYITTYDMNGPIGTYKQKIAKLAGTGHVSNPTVLSFESKPDSYSSSDSAYFKINSNLDNTKITYKLDSNPYTNYSSDNNVINIENLEKGLHKIYISAYAHNGGHAEEPLVYHWITGDPVNLTIKDKSFSGSQTITAKDSIHTEGRVLIKNGANIKFSSGKEIILEPGFETEDGSFFETELKEGY